MSLGVEVDTSAAQKTIDELYQRIHRNTLAFELFRNGESFIKDATISGGAIRAGAIETSQPVTNIYNINLGIQCDEPEQNKVAISTDKFEVKPCISTNLESLLKNALKNAAECAALDVARQVAADQKAMNELAKTIRKAIHNDCLAGGIIWQRFGR